MANKISLFLLPGYIRKLCMHILQGKFTYKSPAQVYVDVNGVGYEVNISLNTYSAIQHLKKVNYIPISG